MARFRVIIRKLAEKQIRTHYLSGNKANIKRIQQIISDLETNPYTEQETPNS